MSYPPLPMTEPPADDRRREAALVIGIVLLGCVMRGLRPEAMAVEHFDEGVYASNLYCGHLDPPFAYPMRHLYAPPLFPAMLEWAQIFAGPSAVMWVNVLFGSLMVFAVWWTTREWFGRSAAIAAAILAATSEYHIAFSRMALTDVPLSLFMLLGVYAEWKAILTGRPLWIAAGGLLAGLAWCTKYNGWLTLAITGSGTAAALLVPKLLLGNALTAKLPLGAGKRTSADSGRTKKKFANCKLGRAIVCWTVTAAIAAGMFWWFVVRELAPLGGYAAVAKNHAGYFVGPGGWWSGFVRQAGAHDWVMGWPTCVGIGAAWLACAWGSNGAGLRSVGFSPRAWAEAHATVTILAAAVAMGITARLLTVSGVLAITALAGFVGVVRRACMSGGDTDAERSTGTYLAAWTLLAWFFGLLVSAPLYYPYPRLSLPWVVATWPLAGAAVELLAERLRLAGRRQADRSAPAESLPSSPVRKLMSAVLLTVAVVVVWFLLDRYFGPHQTGRSPIAWGPAWQSRNQLLPRYATILSEIGPAAEDRASAGHDVAAIVYVAGDPAAFYQLSSACRIPGVAILPIAEPAGLKATAGVPTYLVTHMAAGVPEPAVADLIPRQGYYDRPSDLVLLDRMPASELQSQAPLHDVLLLYRIGHLDAK